MINKYCNIGIVRDAKAYSWLFASLGYIFLILPIFYKSMQ